MIDCERFVPLCKMQTRNTEGNTMTSVTQTPMNATLGKKKTKSSKIIDTPVQGCRPKKSGMDDMTMTPTTVMRSVEESNTPSQRAYVTDLKQFHILWMRQFKDVSEKLDDITTKMDALSDRVVDLETKTQPNKQIAALKRYEKDNNFEVNMIKTDMSNLMNNVSTLNANLTVMKNDITTIDSSEINSAEFNSLKNTVRHLKSTSKSDVSNIIRKIDCLSNSAPGDAVVNELKKNIQNLETLQQEANHNTMMKIEDVKEWVHKIDIEQSRTMRDKLRTLIITGLKPKNNIATDVMHMMKYGMGIETINTKTIEQLNTRPGALTMLRVELYTLDDKIRILKNKQKLRHTRDYYQVFIRPEKSQTERIMEANNQTLLEMLPNREMYNVASNGRIIRRSQQTDMEQTMEPNNNQREDVYSRTYYSNPQTRDKRRSPSNRYANYEHNNVKYKKRPEQYQRRFADSNNENYSYQQKNSHRQQYQHHYYEDSERDHYGNNHNSYDNSGHGYQEDYPTVEESGRRYK